MKRSATLALVLCLALLGTAIEARADCRYVRGSIAETRISLKKLVASPGNNILDGEHPAAILRIHGYERRSRTRCSKPSSYFANPDNCREYLVARRWPNGVTCPTCGSKAVYFDKLAQRLGVQDPPPASGSSR